MKISTRNLTKTYQDADRQLKVIHDLSIDFPEDCSIAVVGRSGIGKSTLLHLLGGLDRPSSGEILYDEQNIAALSNDALSEFRGRNVGFIFQFHHLLPEFSALENVAMPLIILGTPEAQALEQARAVLDRVGLSERLEHVPGKLSGGEQQRVAIARAVVAQPRIILADEPTGNLDLSTARDAQQLLLEINRELHNTLIVVTHSAELANAMDSVVEMQPGGGLTIQRANRTSL
ncbi:MAG: ABC transporter ATP-binding protein [Deltaproteobacteria bacterium]|nr:ABC transporter ATP-binding protein [Deltaproteobacteria bacterium]